MATDNFDSSEQKLDELLSSHLFDCIPEACIILDQRFYIVKMNSKAEHFFIFPKEYMMSIPFFEIAPQHINTDLFHAMYKVINDREEISVEFPGSVTNRWYEGTLRMIGDYIALFFRNITHYKHIENELLRAEERFSAVFRNSHALMAVFNLDNYQHISVNDSYANFFGYNPNEIIGKTKDEIFATVDSHSVQTQIQNNPLSKLITVKTKANVYKNIILTSESININGKPCLLEIGIDITDNLRYQKELQMLEHLNLLGQMSASIAHEIRNPLQTIKGFLQLLQFKEELLPYQSHFTLMIDELNRTNQIITEFLSLSRTKPTSLELRDINDIITSILPLIKAQALNEDKIIEVEQKSVPKTMLDEDEIKQVLLNLIKNGLDATESKGSVKIITDSDHTSVKLIVSDHGQGIPSELQENIGIPFFTTKINGTGLGLSMSLNILERHNAKVNFVSNENGTTFYIDFPLTQ